MFSRRKFLLFCCTLPLAKIIAPIKSQADSAEPLSFFVAGARYQEETSRACAGEAVSIRRELWNGERCYGVYDSDEIKLGYVPRSLVPMMQGKDILRGQLKIANRYTVPWKWYWVAVNPS